MSAHEQIADDLFLYALGALDGEERLALERHLQECSACRRELESFRGDLALLAFSATGPVPPPHARERLMQAIAKEPRRAPVRTLRTNRWLRPLEWAAAAAAILVIVVLLLQNTRLRQHIANLEAGFSEQQQQLLQTKEIVASLNSSEAAHFTLTATKALPQPEGRAIYSRQSGTLVFIASDMPQLPPQKTYELWLIPSAGAPIPAGLFRTDAHGSATVIRPPLPAGVEAKTFAITIEPLRGSPAPTSQPIMVGTKS
jgi:anti-sigma-K factor RskA